MVVFLEMCQKTMKAQYFMSNIYDHGTDNQIKCHFRQKMKSCIMVHRNAKILSHSEWNVSENINKMYLHVHLSLSGRYLRLVHILFDFGFGYVWCKYNL